MLHVDNVMIFDESVRKFIFEKKNYTYNHIAHCETVPLLKEFMLLYIYIYALNNYINKYKQRLKKNQEFF